MSSSTSSESIEIEIPETPQETGAAAHARAFSRLPIKPTADEFDRINALWTAQSNAQIWENSEALEAAEEQRTEILKAIALRISGEAVDVVKAMDRDAHDFDEMLSATEWLLAKVQDGFTAVEQDEFEKIILQAR
jgi:hypothetical protein